MILSTPPELPIEGNEYRIGRLDAMTQFHVARRIAPILAVVGISISELMSPGQKGDATMIALMGPVAEVLSKMSDEDVEYVIRTCLGVVRRRQEERWVSVQTGKNLQFADIAMPVMVRLTVEVIKENLGGFFPQQPAETQSD